VPVFRHVFPGEMFTLESMLAMPVREFNDHLAFAKDYLKLMGGG
jgi:hypothetical protein